ncbi:MAG: GDSL-type esterase/lipase family protein [Thermodesulfobacteriota bacterium]
MLAIHSASPYRRLSRLILGEAAAIAVLFVTEFLGPVQGLAAWLDLTLAIALLLLLAKEAITLAGRKRGRVYDLSFFNNVLLAFGSLMLCLFVFEACLTFAQFSQSSKDLVIPPAWERRPVNMPGAGSAYYWHGHLHVHNQDGMRRTVPFPPKPDGVFRIMLVGDSLTYGYGLAEEQTYPSLVCRDLKSEYRVECLNLGVAGAQSEDITKTVQAFLPRLDPDLIVYGICLNDFLPSGKGEYASNRAYPFPLPRELKRYLLKQTLAGRFFDQAYDGLLIRLGLRHDFFDDILKDFQGYQTRFARDMKEMNRYVLENRLPPVIALVLDQYPQYNGRGYRIAQAAEKYAAQAGLTVVPTEEYYRRHDGRSLMISRWEGHPNLEANEIFARLLLPAIRKTPSLAAFRKIN